MSPTLFERCHGFFYVPFQMKYKDEGNKANGLTSPPNDAIIWTKKGVSQLAWSHQFFLKTLVDGPAAVWAHDFPLSRPALFQLSYPGGDHDWIISFNALKKSGSSDESTRLPPKLPGFKSRRRRHMWVEFVVGSLLCSKRFFSELLLFSPLLKNQHFQI